MNSTLSLHYRICNMETTIATSAVSSVVNESYWDLLPEGVHDMIFDCRHVLAVQAVPVWMLEAQGLKNLINTIDIENLYRHGGCKHSPAMDTFVNTYRDLARTFTNEIRTALPPAWMGLSYYRMYEQVVMTFAAHKILYDKIIANSIAQKMQRICDNVGWDLGNMSI